jgi:hypothetical protein
VLEENVDLNGQVDYEQLKKDQESLNAYLKRLESLDKEVIDSLDEKQKIAFWINAYNALTLKVVTDNYPIRGKLDKYSWNFPRNSIRQIPGVWSGIKHTIAGRVLSLKEIERDILRKKFNEPMIHLALVCAAKGCPKLRKEPFFGSKLDYQLADQAKIFLIDPSKFVLDKSVRKVRISPIFNWFSEDFEKKYKPSGRFAKYPKPFGSVLHFISQHLPEAETRFLKRRKLRVFYLEFDWRLNDVKVPAIYQAEEEWEPLEDE